MTRPPTTAQEPHADAATVMASARACLDVLRGTSVLVQQSEEALMQLLAVQQSVGVSSPGHRDRRSLEGSASLAATRTGTGHVQAAPHAGGGVAEARQEHEGRSRVDGAARDQQRQQQQQQQQDEHVGGQQDRYRRMLESLVDSLLRVLEAPSCATSPEAASPSAELPSHRASDAARVTQEHSAPRVDRETPRVDDAARHQQQQSRQQRRRASSSAHTYVITVRADDKPRPPSDTTATTATSIVMTSPELLSHIMGYLHWSWFHYWGWELDRTVRKLGSLALVCRAWRDAAQQESLWGPVAKALIPRLADAQDASITQAELQKVGGSYRRYLVDYGRFLSGRYLLRSGWQYWLVLQCDLLGTGPAAQCLFSGEGTIRPEAYHGGLTLKIDSRAGPYFSAASRSGPHRQYASIREYFEALRCLKVRITVHDARTGRRAVLWGGGLTDIREVRGDGGNGYLVTSEAQSLTTTSYGPRRLDGAVGFNVESWGGNDDLPDDQKKYSVLPFLRFGAADGMDVGRMIWSALGY